MLCPKAWNHFYLTLYIPSTTKSCPFSVLRNSSINTLLSVPLLAAAIGSPLASSNSLLFLSVAQLLLSIPPLRTFSSRISPAHACRAWDVQCRFFYLEPLFFPRTNCLHPEGLNLNVTSPGGPSSSPQNRLGSLL